MNLKPSVLVVEDDEAIVTLLTYTLEKADYNVRVTKDGDEALMMVEEHKPDLVLLDWMLPGKTGIQICNQLRNNPNTKKIPIIMISARGEEGDRVEGLDRGADDYLVKPFAFEELLARLESLNKRNNIVSKEVHTILKADELELNLLSREVKRAGKIIDLQGREFKLLEYLLKNKGQIITRTMLLENVWDYNFDPQTNVIDVHISRLRNKIDSGFDKQILKTIRGVGFTIE